MSHNKIFGEIYDAGAPEPRTGFSEGPADETKKGGYTLDAPHRCQPPILRQPSSTSLEALRPATTSHRVQFYSQLFYTLLYYTHILFAEGSRVLLSGHFFPGRRIHSSMGRIICHRAIEAHWSVERTNSRVSKA